MISKLDIAKFGLFNNYNWDVAINKQDTFRRLNIIYGRNYSGKTTLSRVFKCIEDKCLHKDYQDAKFTLTLSNGTYITTSNLDCNFKVRVYNSDFVKENLNWLHNTDGTIKPFTILGAKNIELDSKIKKIERNLGDINEKSGLLYNIYEKQIDVEKKRSEYKEKCEKIDEQLKKRANDVIKIDSNLFLSTASKKNYTISDIKAEIHLIEGRLSDYLLSENQIENRKLLLKENFKENINPILDAKPNFMSFYNNAKELLEKRIKPSEPIIELINNSLLQDWVRNGIERHKNIRETCGFCGGPLGDDIWLKLDAHFNKESEDLRKDVKILTSRLLQAKKNILEFLKLNVEKFYSNLGGKVDTIKSKWEGLVKKYTDNIDIIVAELTKRESDIFNAREIPKLNDVSDEILTTLKEFNDIIDEHNTLTLTLSKDQKKARIELRFSDIANFIKDIDYQVEMDSIENAKRQYEDALVGISPLQEKINELLEEKRVLEAQAKDESKGAELVNQHLVHFFGHNELKLVAIGETPNMRFAVQRDGAMANNLSEGECSLISFCYFVAKMEDELNDESNGANLIIYIDDPISSLDSNHIFFMFSLIESIIAKPRKYLQLFISTHNLDFLKYLKRLTIPKYKPQPGSGYKDDFKTFIIDRRGKGFTVLNIAPDYLKNYITEFNYLFSQIYNCSTSDSSTISVEYQYNFGNNMRKFLEAYLFYKFPNHKMTNDERIRCFFDNDSISVNLINRVINEYSHIGERFDRGMEPVDIDEISKISKLVIEKIKESDPAQYYALVESLN